MDRRDFLKYSASAVATVLLSREAAADELFTMQLFRKSRQTLVFNKFKTCLKNSNTREVQYCNI